MPTTIAMPAAATAAAPHHQSAPACRVEPTAAHPAQQRDDPAAWGQLVTPTRAAAEPGARGPEGLEALGPLEATVPQAERATTGSAPLRPTTSQAKVKCDSSYLFGTGRAMDNTAQKTSLDSMPTQGAETKSSTFLDGFVGALPRKEIQRRPSCLKPWADSGEVPPCQDRTLRTETQEARARK